MSKISKYCIYTIRRKDRLEEIISKGGEFKGDFTEKQSWKTGYALLKDAKQENLEMPIFFSAADDENATLMYVAFLKAIKVRNTGISPKGKKLFKTTYSFYKLRKLEDAQPLNSLVLRKGEKPLSDTFIHPYAICLSPSSFLY